MKSAEQQTHSVSMQHPNARLALFHTRRRLFYHRDDTESDIHRDVCHVYVATHVVFHDLAAWDIYTRVVTIGL